MRIVHTRKQMFAFFMPGFLLGILYVNFFAKHYLVEPGIFSQYFLEQYRAAKMVAHEYLFYLARVRIPPFLLIAGLAFTKVRKPAAFLFLFWTGFTSGILLSMAVMELGILGSILCIVGILPHFLFYVPAYVVVLWYCWIYPQNRWNRQKTVFVVLAMVTGLILEAYVSPELMQIFLRGMKA